VVGDWSKSGAWTWINSVTGEQTASIGYSFQLQGEYGGTMRLNYTVGRDENKKDIKMQIRFETTHPHFGGKRWWLICPLYTSGIPCNRRVGKLYSPPRGLYFGCRHCYDLTYTSCKDSHKNDRIYAMLARNMGTTPEMIKRALSEKW